MSNTDAGPAQKAAISADALDDLGGNQADTNARDAATIRSALCRMLRQCDGGEKLPEHDKPCPVCGATANERCRKSVREAMTNLEWEIKNGLTLVGEVPSPSPTPTRNATIEECARVAESCGALKGRP